jgi:tRNA(Ile)-lysidine synthase
VALAHHLEDQAETVLLQLLRGTGLKGVAAMPEVRLLRGSSTRVFRPLLAVPRAELAKHARTAGLTWVDDESNATTAHDRNFLRHDVAPLLDARFPGWRAAANRFARRAAGAEDLLGELARLDGAPHAAGMPLPLAPALSDERRANVLRAFLAANDLPMPSRARLAEMARQLYEASPDARVRIDHGGVAIVRHRHAVHIERGLADPGAWRVDWHGELELDLGPGRGCVSFAKARGDGLARAPEAGADWYFRARAGGERIRLAAARPTRTLKNLLQEHRVPAWQRQGLPLLFHGGRLAWVPGIGIAAEFACGAAQEGFRPCWTVAGRAPLC